MAELTFTISSITENDYDEVSETVKQIVPNIDGRALSFLYVRDNTETDAASKTAIKTDLTDKGYSWDSEA